MPNAKTFVFAGIITFSAIAKQKGGRKFEKKMINTKFDFKFGYLVTAEY